MRVFAFPDVGGVFVFFVGDPLRSSPVRFIDIACSTVLMAVDVGGWVGGCMGGEDGVWFGFIFRPEIESGVVVCFGTFELLSLTLSSSLSSARSKPAVMVDD